MQEYFGETEDILEAIQQGLSEWQSMFEKGEIRKYAVDEVFRYVHSLKGLSSSFSVSSIVELCQLIERILRVARVDTSFIDRDKFDLISHLVDDICREFEAIIRGKKSKIDLDKKKQLVENIIAEVKSRPTKNLREKISISDKIFKSLTNIEEERLFSDVNSGKAIYIVELRTSLQELRSILIDLNAALQTEGDIIAHIPLPSEKKSGQIIAIYLVSTSNKNFKSTIKQKFSNHKLSIRNILKKVKAASTPQKEEKELLTTDYLKKISQTIRVDISRLNRLQQAMNEIFLAKGQLEEINSKYYNSYGYHPFLRESNQAIDTLDRKLRYLQERIIESRLVPVDQIFNKLSRMISRMLPQNNKTAQLITSGSETELDGALVEQLSDPLMHIIRNAVDHGIESDSIRKKKGKEEIGKIYLRAYPQGSKIVIEVEDDGQGMDVDKIRQKAIEMKFISPDKPLSNEELLKVVFQPGFSTKDTFSEISGMGVGMDAVKKSIIRLGGSIYLESAPDKGTKVTILVPITLAVIKVALANVSSHIVAIPLVSVEENLKLNPDVIKRSNGIESIFYQDQYYPLLDLSEEFKLKANKSEKSGSFGIIVSVAENEVCLRVDSLLEQRDVIIMPIGRLLSYIPGLAGAAEISSKRIALVLDVAYFVGRGTFVMKQIKTSSFADSQHYRGNLVAYPFPSVQNEVTVDNQSEEAADTSLTSKNSSSASNNYLTFNIDKKRYAVDCMWVQEVVKGMEVTPLFRTNPLIEGISQFRGRVVPILNLKTNSQSPFNGNKLVVMINYNDMAAGFLIDKVGAIISSEEYKFYKSKEKFSKSRFKYNNKNINILNLNMIAQLREKDILL